MAVWALRAFFLLVSAGAGWHVSRLIEFDPFWGLLLGITLFTIVFAMEAAFTGKDSVANLLAIVFGIAAGLLLAILAFNITTLTLPAPVADDPEAAERMLKTNSAIRITLTVMLCYLCTIIIFRTRDRFRFVIPYMEFKREQKGPRAFLLDTSALIDGRIAAVGRTGFIETPVFIPDFVLEELHSIADAADRLKRARGRRGLDLVTQLQRTKGIDVSIYETGGMPNEPVDSMLIRLARELDAHICTTDYNLNKVAQAQGIVVLNLNDLASALRPSVIPGEILAIHLIRRGEEATQGVGYLDDGTMVVVEEARQQIGNDVNIEITRVLQRTSGRIIFGKLL